MYCDGQIIGLKAIKQALKVYRATTHLGYFTEFYEEVPSFFSKHRCSPVLIDKEAATGKMEGVGVEES